MKLSLPTRVSVLLTLVIVVISVASTYLFVATHIKSKERGLLARGNALSYALAKAAEEGLLNEDLNLIKKASYIVKASDVTLAQVYSNIWEAVDSYPFERMKEEPSPEAVRHFTTSSTPMYVKQTGGYDFYSPIVFRASVDSPPLSIGFVRIGLSSAAIGKDIKEIIFMNIMVSVLITLFAIISISILIRRLVINPVMGLYHSVSMFKNGVMPDNSSISAHAAGEIQELSVEFAHMCGAIREKEDKLVESDRRIRALFERVEHAIFRLDQYGNIVEANNRFTALFGGVSGLCDIFVGNKTATDCLRNAISDRGLHIEDKAVGGNGEELFISLSLYPETDGDGNVTGFDGYVIDVTEKKRMEERLIRSQKMEAVGTLAGGMAHDFNNLLTAILGYAEIILSMTKNGDPFNRPATIIYDAAKRGADFGKKILTITRKEKMEAKLVNINEIVRNSIELLQRSIPKNIEIVTYLQEDLPLTKADPSQLQQVVINLVLNARDAMPEGGRLSIETATVGTENGASNNKASEAGGFVKLGISDSGIGIDTVTQRKIFDPFFTTKEIGKGTGLGLYIVHSIVNNHGGYINLYSEPLKGTQFRIYLPVTKAIEPEEEFSNVSITGSGTVLIIDDEADVREVCRDMLEPLGYTVLSAADGNSGLNIFREMKGSISLIVLDMIMPKMGGSEVFQALRTISDDVRILLCSGYSQNGFAGIDELLKRGAVGFVQKPFSRQTIAVAIKKAIEN